MLIIIDIYILKSIIDINFMSKWCYDNNKNYNDITLLKSLIFGTMLGDLDLRSKGI